MAKQAKACDAKLKGLSNGSQLLFYFFTFRSQFTYNLNKLSSRLFSILKSVKS